jgi:two-component system sensor histidine kinase KdpD
VARTLRLAEALGAKSVSLPGRSVVETVIDYARRHNVTKIIAGKPLRPRWQELLRGSPVDQLIRQSGHIDVYVISSPGESSQPIQSTSFPTRFPWPRYLESFGWVLLATLLGELVRLFISPTNLVMLYLLVVVITALRLGRGPAIMASILSVLAFDFFFVPPRITFAVSDTQYFITFASLLIVGVVISTLASRARDQAEAARRRETHTAALYELSRDLTTSVGLSAVLQAIMTQVSQTFSRQVVLLLPQGDTLVLHAASPGFDFNDNEYAVAVWAFQHGQPAGRGTATLPAATSRYLPLKTASAVVGVLGVKPADPHDQLTPEQRRLLDTFAGQAALAIERAQLAEQARQAQLLQETERLQTALLNSISHDLRTPLAAITGVLSSLQEDEAVLDQATRRELVETARQEADRMNRLVGNLLDMTRLEAGAMKVALQPADIEDVIGVALAQLAGPLEQRPVRVDIPAGLPLTSMDFVLMVQVLVNLLDNALKYSPAETPLDIQVYTTDSTMRIDIADRGVGIPAEELSRVFDKFYRVQRPGHKVSGTGLGLSICKGIIEAHGGQISVQNRAGGGTIVSLSLPLPKPNPAITEAAA